MASATLACGGPQARHTPGPTSSVDTDRDSIPDACDKCPSEPEDADCPVGDGCPGSHCRASCFGESSYTDQRATVPFEGATLHPSARTALARVAGAMKDLEARLYICNDCGPRRKLFLQQRLGAVRDHLRRLGVPAGRIESDLYCLHKVAVDSLELHVITIRSSQTDPPQANSSR